MLIAEKNFGWIKDFYLATRKSLERELSSEGVLQLTLPNDEVFYIGRPDIINKNVKANKGRFVLSFANFVFRKARADNSGKFIIGITGATDKDASSKAYFLEENPYFLCTADFKKFGDKVYFNSLTDIFKYLGVDFLKESEGNIGDLSATTLATDLILKGLPLRDALNYVKEEIN